MNQNFITFSKGPQFRDGEAVAPFMLTWVLFFFSIYVLFEGYAIFLLISLPLMAFLINFTLDIQGVEIDKIKGLVRLYKLDLVVKYGKWEALNEYYEVSLDLKSYNINQRSFNSASNGTISESHSHFLISLVHPEKEKTIILKEKDNYWDAVAVSLQLSKDIELPFHDLYDLRLLKSKNRRR